MTDPTQTATDPAEKPANPLAIVAADAERIAASFVPDVNKLPKIVGVLIKQVEQLAGGELKPLTDEVLGIAPEPDPTAPAAPAAPAGQTGPTTAELQTALAEQAETIKQLQEQVAADKQAAATIESSGAGGTQTGGGSEA